VNNTAGVMLDTLYFVHNHPSHNNKQVEPPGLCDLTIPTQQLALGGCLLVEATNLRLAKSVTFGELEECGTQLGSARSI